MPQLAEYKDCTGCSACANVCAHSAIIMKANQDGFLYPDIDDSLCVQCSLCEQVCPILKVIPTGNTETPKVFAMWHNQDRTVSSSGGAFSALARNVLAQGGKVFGAAFDEDLNLRHISISSTDELSLLRGSKYVQSNIGSTLKEVKKLLIGGKPVLYCGTPCQIAGLKSFLRKPYSNLLTLDLVCHGVPSSKIFQSYLNKLQKELNIEKIQSYQFRHLEGWGFSPSVKVEEKTKKLYGTDNLYMEAFSASALFRESCYHCPFAKLPREGDCSIADFWGIGRHGIPFKYDVMKGVSLILVNNKQGEDAIKRLQDSFVMERDLKEALIENHNINHPSVRHPYRDEIIKDFLNENTSLSQINNKYHLVDSSLKGIIKMCASKWGLFSIAKRIYNKYKSL